MQGTLQLQCMMHCMRSLSCSYTVLTAVDLQYTLHYTASILHFGLGYITSRVSGRGNRIGPVCVDL